MVGLLRKTKGTLRRRVTAGTEVDHPLRLPIDGGVPTIRLSPRTVDEDGGLVGLLSITNSPDGVTWTFAITTDPDSKFSIDNDTELHAADLDFETATSHSVTIEATPSAGDPISRIFVITVINVIEPPVNLMAPVVTGVAQVGEVIEVVPGTYTDMGPSSSGVLTYQWKDAADDSEIDGQTAVTFAVTGEWVGESVYCTETATNSAGSVSEDTEVIGPFDPAPGFGAVDGFLILNDGAVSGLHLGMI